MVLKTRKTRRRMQITKGMLPKLVNFLITQTSTSNEEPILLINGLILSLEAMTWPKLSMTGPVQPTTIPKLINPKLPREGESRYNQSSNKISKTMESKDFCAACCAAV